MDDDPSIYKPDMKNLEPKLDRVLDLDELIEGRKKTDTWTNLEYLTKGLERISKSNRGRRPIRGTKHEKHYISYLNKKYDGKTYLKFLERNRIELNTIMTQIDAKRFWNWLYSEIIKAFPTRNYLRVIPVPPYEISLPVLAELNTLVEEKIEECIEDEADLIEDELRSVKGFLNTKTKMVQIDNRLNEVVDDDRTITRLNTNLKAVVKSVFGIDMDE